GQRGALPAWPASRAPMAATTITPAEVADGRWEEIHPEGDQEARRAPQIPRRPAGEEDPRREDRRGCLEGGQTGAAGPLRADPRQAPTREEVTRQCECSSGRGRAAAASSTKLPS